MTVYSQEALIGVHFQRIMCKFFTCLACLFSCLGSAAPVAPVPVKNSVEEKAHSVVVLGGGIGALTSAIYLARGGLEPVVIEGPSPGGLITQSHSVQNWPGEMEISGPELAEKVRKQAEENGVKFRSEEVVAVDFSKRPYMIVTRSIGTKRETKILAESVIIAMGTRPNFLGVLGEADYWGRGVTNCAICDGSLYRDQVVGVVGGGDAAVLEGLYLSNIAKEVNIFVRKGSFKGTEEKRLQTLLAKPNVKVHFNTQVKEVRGNQEGLTSVLLKTAGKSDSTFPINGLFLAIGSQPNSQIFQHALQLDEKGYILLKKDQETSLPGIYAIGDIVDPKYKQAISAAGDGAKAALQAQQYISDRADHLVTAPTLKKAIPPIVAEVIEITSVEQLQHELQSSDIPVFVDFYATWCGPCKQISPFIEDSATTLSGRVRFLKVNVDKVGKLVSDYQIRAMPTVLLFDSNGEIIERKVGPEAISELLKSLHEDSQDQGS